MVKLFGIDRLALESLHVAGDIRRFVRVSAFDFDESRLGNIAALPRFARLLMLLPIRIVESKRFEQARARMGGFVAALHDLRALRVIHRVVFGERHGNDGIRLCQAAQLVLFQHHAHGMIQHAEHGLDVFCVDGCRFQVHGNDDLRAHLPHDVGRQVIQKAAVYIDSLPIANRRKRSRNRHRRAQRHRERAILENV